MDGRGGGGKSSLADRLARVLPGAVTVHSDDIAWNYSRFGWDDLMIEGVLAPLHSGRPVHYQPAGWASDGREGHVDVAATAETVIVEGVGVSRQSMRRWLDATIWVQSDLGEARRRAIVRDMELWGRDETEALRIWDEWELEEVPFLARDRPWERADFIVGTGEGFAHDLEREVSTGPGGISA